MYSLKNTENGILPIMIELSVEFDGVSETMRKLKDAGLKWDRFNKKKRYDLKGLKLLDVEGVFDVIIGMDDVTKTKPDPEPILLALKRLGADREEALMIGDNYHDIVGGQNAGVHTAALRGQQKARSFYKRIIQIICCTIFLICLPLLMEKKIETDRAVPSKRRTLIHFGIFIKQFLFLR